MAASTSTRWIGAFTLGAALLGCGASGPAGTYELDVDETVAQAEEAMNEGLEEAPEPMREMMKTMMETMVGAIEKATVELTLADDGTFAFHADMMGDQSTTTGTWKVDGEQIAMTSAVRDGEDYVSTLKGSYGGSWIRLEGEDGGEGQELVLRRK